jgi:hypothetical protein
MSIVTINWILLADTVEQKVMSKLKEDLANWADDRGMRSMFLADASDGLEVCDLLAKGDWQKVENRLYNMDTAARDYLYEWIKQAAGEGFFAMVRK